MTLTSVIDPNIDVGQELARLVGQAGSIENVMGGFRIKVLSTRGFPWEDVVRLLLYRDFKVDVRLQKPDLLIEARL